MMNENQVIYQTLDERVDYPVIFNNLFVDLLEL